MLRTLPNCIFHNTAFYWLRNWIRVCPHAYQKFPSFSVQSTFQRHYSFDPSNSLLLIKQGGAIEWTMFERKETNRAGLESLLLHLLAAWLPHNLHEPVYLWNMNNSSRWKSFVPSLLLSKCWFIFFFLWIYFCPLRSVLSKTIFLCVFFFSWQRWYFRVFNYLSTDWLGPALGKGNMNYIWLLDW